MTADEFRAILARLGLSQAAAARRLVRAPRTINRWYHGQAPIGVIPAAAIRAWLPPEEDFVQTTDIAQVVHEANRAYCTTLGDDSQPPWAEAPDWQVTSALEGIENIRVGAVQRPADSHESWLTHKTGEGWTYGPVKDPAKKEHPCMVPFADLPADQQVKDALFFGIVTTLLPFLEAPCDPSPTPS